jgi:DNA-binding transcriptional LysR family regulator
MSHLNYLRTFLEAYRTGSFSKAADHLGITQPAASMHIQALESLVGKPLFVRRARGVVATPAADDLARSIAPHLDGLEAKVTSLRNQSKPLGWTIHIVGPSDFLYTHMALALAPLITQGVQLRFHTGNRERIYALLNDGTADLAVTASIPDDVSHGYIHLATERLLLVAAPALAQQIEAQCVTAQALESFPLIAYDEQLPLIRSFWLGAFKTQPSLQAAITVPDMRIVESLVRAGHGWSVIPEYLCHASLAAGTLVPVTFPLPPPENSFYLAWSKGALRNPRIGFIRDYLAELVEQGVFASNPD